MKECTSSDSSVTEVVSIDGEDPEIRSQVATRVTELQTTTNLGSKRFDRFSKFLFLRQALANLIVKVMEFKEKRDSQVYSKVRRECAPYLEITTYPQRN